MTDFSLINTRLIVSTTIRTDCEESALNTAFEGDAAQVRRVGS